MKAPVRALASDWRWERRRTVVGEGDLHPHETALQSVNESEVGATGGGTNGVWPGRWIRVIPAKRSRLSPV